LHNLTIDGKFRHIRHSQEYWPSEQDIPRLSANDYLNETAEILQIPKEQLKNLHRKVSFLDPHEQDIEYHLSEEKHLFDSITVGYYQTYMNVPVWRRGLTSVSFLRNLLNIEESREAVAAQERITSRLHKETKLMSGKFFIYKYDPEKRYAGQPSPSNRNNANNISEEVHKIPIPELPAVSDRIRNGQSYVVAEVIFTANSTPFNGLYFNRE
jgi:hypothetical protein